MCALHVRGMFQDIAPLKKQANEIKEEMRELDRQLSALNERRKRSEQSSASAVFMRAFFLEAKETLPKDVFLKVRNLAESKVSQGAAHGG